MSLVTLSFLNETCFSNTFARDSLNNLKHSFTTPAASTFPHLCCTVPVLPSYVVSSWFCSGLSLHLTWREVSKPELSFQRRPLCAKQSPRITVCFLQAVGNLGWVLTWLFHFQFQNYLIPLDISDCCHAAK